MCGTLFTTHRALFSTNRALSSNVSDFRNAFLYWLERSEGAHVRASFPRHMSSFCNTYGSFQMISTPFYTASSVAKVHMCGAFFHDIWALLATHRTLFTTYGLFSRHMGSFGNT